MAYTDINSEDRLVQATFANHLRDQLGWESVYAWNQETCGPDGTLGRTDTREVVLTRDLRAALARLNAQLPPAAIAEAVQKLTRHDFSRSLLQHNQEFYKFIRDGVPVSYKDAQGRLRDIRAQVIDFKNGRGADGKPNNRFLAVRELKLTGLRTPGYNRRADLVCFVNGLPLVFIELKAVYKNIRAGFDGNLRDYKDEHVIAHAFHHNAFLIVSNGHRARYGSITSGWEHFAEWKRDDERDKGSVEAEVLLNGMLAHDRLLDMVENFILFEDSKSMLVCIDKITCGRMYQRIFPRWQAKLAKVKALIPQKEAEFAVRVEEGQRDAAEKELVWLRGQAESLEETIVEIIISEGQNEVADFKKWGVDIIPHRALMKQGFETADGKRVDVESAFKNPEHPFRVVIVCAMWLTGFDVECLSTLYVDKPMKAHTLMQAIARANRVYPGKAFGLIVGYNGMLKSLREALAQYALGEEGVGEEEIVAPI